MTPKTKRVIPASLIDSVCDRVSKNLRVRRTLPASGRLHIDRQLPFLCVYRQPTDDEDAATELFVKGEASYLIVSAAASFRKSVSELVRRVSKSLSDEFGAFLLFEIWSAPEGGRANDPAVPTVLPTFTIHGPKVESATSTIESLEARLKRVRIQKHGVEVEVVRDGKSYPPDMKPLFSAKDANEMNCTRIGLALPPVYRKVDSQTEYPLLIRSLRRSLGLAMRQMFFEFSRRRTTHRPPHYHALGRKAVVKSVWDIDRRLAAVSNSFDYLLQLTPVNTTSAWKQFQRGKFEKAPEFHYRPLPVDPGLLKRELYSIPLERIEDPALHRLFQEKQDELDIKINMLRDRDTPRFMHESLQLFGCVEDSLHQLANQVLVELHDKRGGRKVDKIDAEQFAQSAENEFAYYRQCHPDFRAKAVVTSEVSGMIVSRGRLMIPNDMSVPVSRVDALLQHEVGTHLVTYYNGRAQPFQQLYSGLAGYEELQEGLAVMTEYLVGGLSRERMRQLAARVIAARCLVDGATFVDTYRVLINDYGFAKRPAYTVTMRIFRGGGLTKDVVYLRGLDTMLRYIQKGGDLQPLFVGKMAVEHIPIIRELQYRKVLAATPVIPRYMENPMAVQRLDQLRDGKGSVVDLVAE